MPKAQGYGFYSPLPFVCFQEARISHTAQEQSAFHADLLSLLSSESGCSIIPGFLTCEKKFLLAQSVSPDKFR